MLLGGLQHHMFPHNGKVIVTLGAVVFVCLLAFAGTPSEVCSDIDHGLA
jgi:hypothetical protein